MTNYFVYKNFVALFLAALFLITSCSRKESLPKANVFHYNQHNNISSLDPAFAKSQNNVWAVNQIYSTLLTLNDSLIISASLAKSWSLSKDGLEYEFRLRDDVIFHRDPCFGKSETRKLIASDVVYSFNRLIDTVLNAPGSWIFKGRVSDIHPFIATNDTTLLIRLKQRFSPFPSLLTMQYCSIVPHEAVDYYGIDFFRNPVGSGPFRFKKWLENQGLFLVRNNDYFEWKDSTAYSNLDGVRTSFISERSLAFLELINRRIDYFSGLESSYIHTALEPDGRLKEQYIDSRFNKSPYLNFEYMGINPNAPGAHPLLRDIRFRKALNFGVDRSLMLRSLRNNVGVPANAGVITRGLPSYDPQKVKGFEYDRDSASVLLSRLDAEALKIPLIIHTSKDYLDLTSYIARQWEDLGLKVLIEVMESATLRNAMRNGEIPLFRASWIADYPDAESFLSMFYSRNGAPPNYTHFRNAEYDMLYERSIASDSEEQKMELYQAMDRLLIREAPVVFLFYDEIAGFSDKSIQGMSNNALNLLQLKNIVKLRN